MRLCSCTRGYHNLKRLSQTKIDKSRKIIMKFKKYIYIFHNNNQANHTIYSLLVIWNYLQRKKKEEYETSLKDNRFSAILTCTSHTNKKTNRKRNTIWLNPPYNKNKSNVGKIFITLIHKHFTPSNNTSLDIQ